LVGVQFANAVQVAVVAQFPPHPARCVVVDSELPSQVNRPLARSQHGQGRLAFVARQSRAEAAVQHQKPSYRQHRGLRQTELPPNLIRLASSNDAAFDTFDGFLTPQEFLVKRARFFDPLVRDQGRRRHLSARHDGNYLERGKPRLAVRCEDTGFEKISDRDVGGRTLLRGFKSLQRRRNGNHHAVRDAVRLQSDR